MATKSRVPVEGIPDLSVDRTFVHLVVGLAMCGDTRTVTKYLGGQEVGRSAVEREVLTERLYDATKRAVEIRATSERAKRIDTARLQKRGAR